MIKTYKDLKQTELWKGDDIPKWIFKLGNESVENLHPEIIDLYTKQLEQNPEYTLFYFSEVEREEFIKDLNQPNVTATYEKLIPPAYKCDFFRYLLAYYYGGVFMDFSTHSLIPLNDIIKSYKQVLARDFGARDGICAGFIATVSKEPFFEGAIEKCIYHTKYNLYCADPLDVTSPKMLGAVYRRLNQIEEIAVGRITEDLYLYDYKDADYLYEGDVPIVKYRIPNHYSILYNSRSEDLYYAKLWHERRIYKTNDIKTFKDIKDRKWEGEGIPKWIFKTGPFKAEDLPIVMREIYLDILAKNPGYELFYFSNEDCMLSIHHHYGEEYFRLHQKLIPTAYQADFWRYCILNQYGGCYGDFSQIPLVPYDELIEGVDRVFVRDDPSNKSFLYNAVMCAKPGDEIIAKAIDISAKNIRTNNHGISSLDVTGPTVLGQAFLHKGYNLNPRSKEISLGDYNGSRILQHRYSGGFVCDKDAKNVFLTKLSNHFGLVYDGAHKNIHYDQAWKEKKVFR
jgi:mannosyltransferase OCH1-like enzyme